LAQSSLAREQAALRQAIAVRRSVVDNGQTGKLAETENRTLAYPTLLAVPLLLKEIVHGGLILYFAQPQVFSEETMELAVTFGHQVALALENAHLRDQVREVAVAEERNRLARDLHDAVTQSLFSASLIAAALPHLWEAHSPEVQPSLDKLVLLTRGALAEMRTLLLELRPQTLVESKLGALLAYLADALTGRTRIPVTVTIDRDGTLPPEVQITFYRIAQESLNNIGKHAKASHVTLNLQFRPEKVKLWISDDGCGFDLGVLPPGHLGISIMHERAKAIDAILQVISQPGAGTQIILTWPDA
jgi:two-component system nitrate/nitrite sensor histidine kinase NarX